MVEPGRNLMNSVVKKSIRIPPQVIKEIQSRAKALRLSDRAFVEQIIEVAWESKETLAKIRLGTWALKGGRGREGGNRQFPLYVGGSHFERLVQVARELDWPNGRIFAAAARLHFGWVDRRGQPIPGFLNVLCDPLSVGGECVKDISTGGYRRPAAIRDGGTVFVDWTVIRCGITRKTSKGPQPISEQCWNLLLRCKGGSVNGLTSVSQLLELLRCEALCAAMDVRWRECKAEEESNGGGSDYGDAVPIEALAAELNLEIVAPDRSHFRMAFSMPDSVPLDLRIGVAAAIDLKSEYLAVATLSSDYDALHSEAVKVFKPDDLLPRCGSGGD